MHRGAEASLVGFVFAVGGDSGLEDHGGTTLDGDPPAAPRRPVRRLVVAQPGDVLDRQRGSSTHDRGEPESLGRDGARLNATRLHVEGIGRQCNPTVVHQVVDGGVQPLGEQHQRRPEDGTGHRGVGHRHGLVGRLAETHDVEEHGGTVVGRVVEQLLHGQGVDSSE
jgi:hypothetical protein